MLSDGPFAESPISGRAFVLLTSAVGAPYIDQVQTSNQTGQSTTTFVTPAQNVLAGSCLVVCFQHAGPSESLTRITDDAGNAYQFVGAVSDVNRGIEMWICRNPAVLASNAVTAFGSGLMNYWTLTVLQYAGNIAQYDVTGKTGAGTTAAIATASFNTAYASEYVFCFIETGAGVITAGANFVFDSFGPNVESWAPSTTQTGVVGDATNSVPGSWLAVAASVRVASYVNSFAYYKPVTIDHTQVGGADLVNYTVAIGRGTGPQSADADLRTVGNGGYVQSSSGYDLRPFADSGLTMPLDFELVPGVYRSTTGAYEMHVQVPNISSTVNTVFYLAFGDPGLTTDASSTAAWRPRYVLVVHAPNGSTLSLSDSSTNGLPVINHGATAAAGNLDGGIGFNGASAYVQTGVAGLPFGNAVRSVSAWIKPTDVTTLYNVLFGYGTNAASQAFYVYVDPANSKVLTAAYFNSATAHSSSTIAANVWTFIVVTYDGTTIRYYKNGTADGTATFLSGTPNTNTLVSYIGADMDLSVFATGSEDEVRVCNQVLSPGVILADYNAQKASSTFLLWGSKVPVGGSVTYLFRAATLSGLQAGGPLFVNPLG